MSQKLFLYYNGLKNAARILNGNETLHTGIRPWGMHAGNKMTMLAYPLLLFEEMKRLGKTPSFRYIVSINDWEPHRLRYLDEDRYFFNIFPQKSSFQYTPDPNGCCKSIVDHWEGRIARQFDCMADMYPSVKLEFRRNSAQKNNEAFMSMLRKTLIDSKRMGEIIRDSSGFEVSIDHCQYAGAVCPSCKSAQGTTSCDENKIIFACNDCGKKSHGTVKDFDYWWYHTPMLVARIIAYDLDVCIRGGDHYRMRRVEINKNILNHYSPHTKEPITIVAPLVLGKDGQKMAKTFGNESDCELYHLMSMARVDEPAIQI